ncbi:MAG: TonB-dependent receptor [Acidobacteriaceae bacterium]
MCERKRSASSGAVQRMRVMGLLLCSGVVLVQSQAAQSQAASRSTAPSSVEQGRSVPARSSGSVGAGMQAEPAPAGATAGVAGGGSLPEVVSEGGTIQGRVVAGSLGKRGGVPLPGVAVTATNTLTGRRYTTTTDVNGKYAMVIPRDGRYVVRAELMGFATATQEKVLTGMEAQAARQGIRIVPGATDFGLQLASQVEAEAKRSEQSAGRGAGFGVQGLGMQGLSLSMSAGGLDATAGGGDAGAALPTMLGIGDGAEDSVTVSGEAGQTNGLANLSEEEIQQRIQSAIAQARASGMLPPGGNPATAAAGALGGMMGRRGFGGGRGGFGGFGGFGRGGFRNFNPAQPHGSIFYQTSNAALNSAQWSPDLQPQTKPSSYTNNFGVTLAGSPYIPRLIKPNPSQFMFLNVTGQKNLNAFLGGPSRVPTALEREGNFSQSTQVVNGVSIPVEIYDPKTGQPVPDNNLAYATTPISPQALALLQYYPAPNIPTNAEGYNYETISNEGNNQIAINTRYVRTLGGNGGSPFAFWMQRGANLPVSLRQNINLAYHYSHSASDERNIFLPLGGTTATDGNLLSVGYMIGYGRFSSHATVTWNRLSTQTQNYFTNTSNDPSTTVGVTVPNFGGGLTAAKFYNGLPMLNISNFATLSNTTPSLLINQAISFSYFAAYRHARHNLRLGFDVRRVQANSLGGNDPLGQFTFSGYATESPADQARGSAATTGSGFADFLLGLPQSTALEAPLYKIYLRENVLDWFATDDFRASPNLTLNYGIRYEYFAPFTEENNRLVNLDHNANFTEVDPVEPGGTGTYEGVYPAGLINPDRAMYAPRLGFAWKVNGSSLVNGGSGLENLVGELLQNWVVRGGYGINYNTGQFATIAKSLSSQPPFAVTQTNDIPVASAGNPTPAATGCVTTTTTTTANMTLAHGFGCSAGEAVENDYAVNKNYRLGMVQAYNLNLQRTLPLQIVMNIGYSGAKGSDLDVVGSPNSTPDGVTTVGIAPFSYETSEAGSHANSLVVSLQKRQYKGVSMGVTYTYGHSIDDASSVGGSSPTSVQDFRKLYLEEGNSSFDIRQSASGQWLLELPFGPNRRFFNQGGFWSHALDGFLLSGTFTFSTGRYFTPSYSGSQAEAASGDLFTLRPDRVFSQPIKGSGKVRDFFNKAAFTAPAGEYGTASRDSIEGPGTVAVDASLSRMMQFAGTRSLEVRVTANNVFNTVQYSAIDTTENSANFGEVTSSATMRNLLVQARYRF